MSQKKINNIFQLMRLFVEKKMICQNGNILNRQGMIIDHVDSLGYNIRTLRRYLDDIEKLYPHIIKIKKSSTHCYKLESASEIFHTFLSHTEDISWLIQLIYQSDKNLLSQLANDTKERLENIAKSEKDIFLFQNLPFDELKKESRRDIFNRLKLATKNNEYRNIYYHYNEEVLIKNAQCLKMIFMDSNWYIAIASQERGLLLLRMAFISKVEYAIKESYQPTQLSKYSEHLKNIQNPMTLFGVKVQKAHLLASAKVAKYFKADMKKFLSSQTFVKENSTGAIEFTLNYTQPLEILPFIKKWLPNIEILSPQSLQDEMIQDLQQYLKIV